MPQGSYGVVGLCLDDIDGSTVAIKKISVRHPNDRDNSTVHYSQRSL